MAIFIILCPLGMESPLDDQIILDTIQNQVSKSEEELLADALLLEDLESSIPALEVSLLRLLRKPPSTPFKIKT